MTVSVPDVPLMIDACKYVLENFQSDESLTGDFM